MKPSILINHDITAVLVVLNNVQGIRSCLTSVVEQNLNDIVVVDGGSTDGTIEELKKFPCELYQIGKTGLSHSRQFGVDKVKTKYVLLVDSDNILHSSCAIDLKTYLMGSNFSGVSAKKVSFIKNNIFCSFQEWMNSKKINVEGDKLVIGTPALYITDVVKEVRYDPAVKKGDDTDFCYRLKKVGHSVGTGSGLCYEKMQDNLTDFLEKAYLYGQADAEFFVKHKERRLNIGTHVLRNYLIKMVYSAILDIKLHYLPLVFSYSIMRMAGLYISVVKNSFRSV